MPRDSFGPGTGPQGMHRGLRITVQAPSTTSTSAPILPGQPLRWARLNENTGAASTLGLGRQAALCAADAVPELIAIERCERPYQPFAVTVLKPGMVITDVGTGTFVEKVPYTGSPATGTDLAVIADGANAFKIVAAASGVGRVISYEGGKAEVLF